MGKNFNERTEVLFQKPSHPREYVKSTYLNKWILLPMCAYKVSVPYPKENCLNLFQETILKLFVGGAKDNEWLAKNLSLNIGLVEFIIVELQNKGLINSRRSLTNTGYALLNDEDDSYEMKIGYVFYNYATKTFMDTFVPDQDFNVATIRSRRGNRVQFYTDDSVANPEYKNSTIVHTDNEDFAVEPTAYDVLKVCRQYKRRSQKLIPDEMEENDNVETSIELPKNIEKVTLLGERKYVYISTYILLPTDDLMNRSKIQMCYPFGNGFSNNILESILSLAKKSGNEELNDMIIGLKKDAYGMTEQQLDKTRQASSEVNAEIKSILSDNIEKYTYVHQMLLTVESDYVQIQALLKQNRSNNWDYIQTRINDYVIDNYNLLAGILIEVIQKYNYYKPDRLTKYNLQNAEILSLIATQCGFNDNENIFKRFFSLPSGTINGAYRASKVDALVAYNLIVASDFNEHPLYNLAKEVPQFISYLNKLIFLRNDGMHGNSIEYDFNELAAYSMKNMYITYLLLDGLTFNNKRSIDYENEKIVDKDMLRVTKNAETQVESLFSTNARKYSTVINKLVSLQTEILLKGDYYPKRLSDIFEAIFKLLCSQRMVPDAVVSIRDYKDREANQEYLNMFKRDGFEIDKIPYFNLRKLTQSFHNYHNATLGPLFYVWYFSEKRKVESLISEVATQIPALVKVIDQIVEVRAHNGKLDFNNSRLDYLKKNATVVINSLLDIISSRCIY